MAYTRMSAGRAGCPALGRAVVLGCAETLGSAERLGCAEVLGVGVATTSIPISAEALFAFANPMNASARTSDLITSVRGRRTLGLGERAEVQLDYLGIGGQIAT